MTETDAEAAIRAEFGPDLADRIAYFLARVVEENATQNLIAASTVESIWSRHALDSLQLVSLAADSNSMWVDIGSGGGFPGIPVALARAGETVLIEPRRKRAEFLAHMVSELDLVDRVTVLQQRVEKADLIAGIISARAVAAIEPLFAMAHHCGGPQTRWLLPRGTLTAEEIRQVEERWAFMFHVEHSRVNNSSAIAVFDGVRRR